MFKKYIPSCKMILSNSESQPKSDNVHIAYLTINPTNISLSWNKENPLSSLYQQLNGSNIYTEDKTEVELLSVSEDLTVRLDDLSEDSTVRLDSLPEDLTVRLDELEEKLQKLRNQ